MIITDMQQRAGLLFLAKNTGRLMLILEDQRWTVPTFARKASLLEDAAELLDFYQHGKILPVELYLSQDRGFEYGTYICLVNEEFLNNYKTTQAWCARNYLPPNLHNGLRSTLNNQLIKIKIETIMELENANRQS
jgi:hypothetical protein